uniref:Uncharacterized protein n=1 Tax=Physcomitrium patens TaxID=3218 RepID=A0A2K1IIV7_PHYPA|nr:hypothetical protein PHYPA_027900 [Physcomitrium patens]
MVWQNFEVKRLNDERKAALVVDYVATVIKCKTDAFL